MHIYLGYKIKKQFKILDFSGKKIYLEKGASDSIFEISDTMEELLFLLKDGITLEEIYKYFLKQYAVNDEYLRAKVCSSPYIKILSNKKNNLKSRHDLLKYITASIPTLAEISELRRKGNLSQL